MMKTPTPSRHLLAALLVPFLMSTVSAGEVHTWISSDGRTMIAEFVDYDDGFVTLRSNGRRLTIAIQKLSEDSARLAAECEARQNEDDAGTLVMEFCQGRLGRKVGNGQCASLAAKALEHAGAQGMGRDFPNAGDYVWGDLVTVVFSDKRKPQTQLDAVCGGDVIQFRNVRFEGRYPGGGTYWMQADHHTAVVESVDTSTQTIQILHQNWNGNKTVRRDALKLSDLKRGWLRIYRPVASR